MTDSVASSEGAVDDADEDLTPIVQQPTGDDGNESESPNSMPFILKKPHANSKLILQNMEEVLNSVKKKHRQKHRRKREQKKLALMEAEAAADTATTTLIVGGHATDLATSKHKHTVNKRPKKPLQEKVAVEENGLSPTKKRSHKPDHKSPLKGMSVSPNNTILKHFPRTPSKAADPNSQSHSDDCLVVIVDDISHDNLEPIKTAKPTNVFELMMNARNKSIGSNTSGREAPVAPDEGDEPTQTKVKRKLLLQEWAEKKGGVKRRLEEEQRAEFVDSQLKQRNKKFKEMLVNGSRTKAASTPTEERKAVASQITEHQLVLNSDKTEKQRERRPRGRPRRLSSADSIRGGPAATAVTVMDAETTEFLSKLSSPTKKRDSLLGYFPKKQSPKELTVEADKVPLSNESTPKSRGRRLQATKLSTATKDSEELIDIGSNQNSSSGRPKRSCAGKNRFYHDFQEVLYSSPKSEKLEKLTNRQTGKKRKDDSDVEVINLDDSNSGVTPVQTPKKLAPLFTRSLPKPCLDPEMLKARQEFLMSGVPDIIRLEQVRQKQYEQSYEETFEFFPKLSHVQQLSTDDLQLRQYTGTRSFKLLPDVGLDITTTIAASGGSGRRGKAKKRYSIGSISTCTAKDFRTAAGDYVNKASFMLAQFTPLAPLENKCGIIKSWKLAFNNFPTYKCYNQMREKYRYFSAIDAGQDTEQVSESFVVTRRTRRSAEAQRRLEPDAAEEKPPVAAPNGELLFTEKYRPMMLEQVLVNLMPVTRLREFLANWSHGSVSSARNSQTLDDSMEFANDSNSNQMPVCNTMVLLGPVSSGKTNAVFALANEMNFNVLEINAGMKRTGKKLIQELQEATQSHQIRKEPSAACPTKAQKNLLKMSLNGMKTKKKSSQSLDGGESSSSSSTELSQSARKCLILIEDADIVFDQLDAGFTDAIYTLAASSKRPVIVVASNPNCAHLQRLMNQNKITFAAPNCLNISRFLSVLALMENCPILYDDIVSLYLYNNNDLRKTLLELQFFIQSGGDQNRLLASLRTPPKKEVRQPQQQSPKFIASPSKRLLSQDSTMPLKVEPDEQLQSTRNEAYKNVLYVHNTLFEFYSTSQNHQWRVPFPIDFRLLGINLKSMFQTAPTLQSVSVSDSNDTVVATTKRRTRSPKKTWLNSAATFNGIQATPLDRLANFYENLSVATSLGADEADDKLENAPIRDRLVPYSAEYIAHDLVERSIEVHLGAPICDYNLIDMPDDSVIQLSDYLACMSLRKRINAMDYEPALRTICRCERLRAMQERRSTRFYHYLRNTCIHMSNFSTKPFDAACDILQIATDVEASVESASTEPTLQT